MAMDVKRDPAILKKKKIRRAILGGLAIIAIIAISVAVSKLKPAAPGVSATTLWFGTVKRGPLVREVHGAGTLVPEDIRWIPATTSGRVENIILRPGAIVKPGTVILVLSNPDLQMQTNNAELQWKSSIAALENARSTLKANRVTQQAAVTDAESQLKVNEATLEANKQLQEQGLVADLTVKQMQAAVDQAQSRLERGEGLAEHRDREREVVARASGSDGQPAEGELRNLPAPDERSRGQEHDERCAADHPR